MRPSSSSSRLKSASHLRKQARASLSKLTRPRRHPQTEPISDDDWAYEDEYFDEDEDEEFLNTEDLLEQLAEQYQAAAEYEDDFAFAAVEMWPALVPNRLGGDKVQDAEKHHVEVDLDGYDWRGSMLGLPLSLPFEAETLAEMDERLEVICCRLIECVKGRAFLSGFRIWNAHLSDWQSMGYPMKIDTKIRLIGLFYELIFVPGLSVSFLSDVAGTLCDLLEESRLDIWDLRLDWRPLLEAYRLALIPERHRRFRYNSKLAPVLLNIAEHAQRYFHPGDVDEMLEAILPNLTQSIDYLLVTQAALVHFLPIEHCQKWLPLIFRMWYSINSGYWDDQASDLMGQLAVKHIDPGESDPKMIDKIPRTFRNTPEQERDNWARKIRLRDHKARQLDMQGEVDVDDDGLMAWPKPGKLGPRELASDPKWEGIRKDVGIFTEREFEFLMTKVLRSLNVPVGAGATHSSASVTICDTKASKAVTDAKKPVDRVQSQAEFIIYSISEDGPAALSNTATPGSSTPVPKFLSRVQNGHNLQRTGSSDSLAAAGRAGDVDRTYLAGSKALDHLSRLLTSCESFFHPSNSGHWTTFLTVFINHLATNFLERWKSEEEPSCRTPAAWRLTPEIKREFVVCLRPLALTAMFGKDRDAAASATGTLLKLSVLEPDLIMPALLERITPALQGLEETSRTTDVIFALTCVAHTFATRKVWRMGGLYVADILNLLLPGIDVNDPEKTSLTCQAIMAIVSYTHLGDISDLDNDNAAKPGARATRSTPRPRAKEDPDDPSLQELEDLTSEEINARIRLSTAAFRDWVPDYVERIFLVFNNLPEEGGKSGRPGGKIEALIIAALMQTSSAVFTALDDKLFDATLQQIIDYAGSTSRPNAVAAIGQLIHALMRRGGRRVFDKLYPLCRSKIISELRSGASQVRTTTTSIPFPSDTALHWWQSILLSLLVSGRAALYEQEYKQDFIDLVRTMVSSTYTERGWHLAAEILGRAVRVMTETYSEDAHLMSPDERESEDFKLNHHLYWGKGYRAAEGYGHLTRPSTESIQMALELIEIAGEQAVVIDDLLRSRKFSDIVWSNDFCRAINVIGQTLKESNLLYLEHRELKTGGRPVDSWLPQEIREAPPTFKTGFPLSDPNDPRYQQVLAFRQRVGDVLVRAAGVMKEAGESDNSVESVRRLVHAIGDYLTIMGVKGKHFNATQSAYLAMVESKKIIGRQKLYHRVIVQLGATVHNQKRLTVVRQDRTRSAMDDKLIERLVDFCLSPFVRVRRNAQSLLNNVVLLYVKCDSLLFPKLFEALKPGTDPDIMKGALYTIRSNSDGLARIARDWRRLPELVMSLLNAHHETKASVQSLVSRAMEELLSRIKEPANFGMDYGTAGVDQACEDLAAGLAVVQPKVSLSQELSQAVKAERDLMDERWGPLVDDLIGVAKNPALNWKYQHMAGRFLAYMLRRDKPTDTRLANFFAGLVQVDHPRMRECGNNGLCRLLFIIATRSMCVDNEEAIFLHEPPDPLTKEVQLNDTSPAWQEQFFRSFKDPLPADPSQAELVEDFNGSWLVWQKTLRVTRLPGMDEQVWHPDAASMPAVDVVKDIVMSETWWKRLAELWAQEELRNYPSAEHTDVILSLAQLYGFPTFEYIRPIVDGFLRQMDADKDYDRHRVRSMFEFIGGLVRGSEEWPYSQQQEVWDWLEPLLPTLFGIIRHDTTQCWDIIADYILGKRDPRRYPAFWNFCIEGAKNADYINGSAFDLQRRLRLLFSCLKAASNVMSAWTSDFLPLLFASIASPYAEVRSLIASAIESFAHVQTRIGYPNAIALLEDILSDPACEKDIFKIRTGVFEPQLTEFIAQMPQLRAERPHGPKAVLSPHDNSAITVITWLTTELGVPRATCAFAYVLPMLPMVFEMRDMNDNPTLQKWCAALLSVMPSVTPPLELLDPLMDALIHTLETSESWRTKMFAMPILSLVYFRNLALLSEKCKARCLDVVALCLTHPNQEVREMAGLTIGGFLRCSQRAMVDVLRQRFTREIKATSLPKKRTTEGVGSELNAEYQASLRRLHGAVLGACALVDAFPYTVPKFIPKLLADVLAPRVSEPAPISTAIRKCVASFKRTHEKYQEKFSEDELSAMNYAQAGNSYYA